MTNHDTDTTPRFLTAEQIARLIELTDGAIFAGTSHLISAVQNSADTERQQRLAAQIESDRRLKVFLGRLNGK